MQFRHQRVPYSGSDLVSGFDFRGVNLLTNGATLGGPAPKKGTWGATIGKHTSVVIITPMLSHVRENTQTRSRSLMIQAVSTFMRLRRTNLLYSSVVRHFNLTRGGFVRLSWICQ